MTEFNIKPIEETLNKIGKEIQSFFEQISPEKDLDVFNPRADFIQTTTGFEIQIDLPGLTKKDIKVELNDNVLVVKGERLIEEVADQTKWIRRERHHGRFSRSFPLGAHVDKSGIKAKFKDGILRIAIAVSEESVSDSTIEID